MKELLFIRTLIVFLILTINSVFGQVNDISFRQISPPGGFTLDGVNTIIQDDLGYIWMGTRQGLIKYDSKNTNWISPSPNDSLSILSEEINDIYCDINNEIWVASNQGLFKFDRQNQELVRINYTYEDGSVCKDIIMAILETENHLVLVADESYFGYLDLNTNQLIRIGKNQINSPRNLYRDNSNKIWIGTQVGEVFRFFPKKKQVNKVISNNAQVNSIYSANEQIWIGTDGEGAKLYSLDGEFIKQVSFGNTSINSSRGHVRVIKKDTYGRLWFGTYEGLYMDDGEKLTRFNPDGYSGLPHNSIYDLYEDKQGALWVGTWSGGVAIIHHSDNNFKTFRHSIFSNSVSNNMISSFLPINKREMLIGTEVGGLNSFNLTTEKFDVIPLAEDEQTENIKSLCKDKHGGIWAGTLKHGLWYRPAGSSNFKEFKKGPEDGKHISSDGIFSLCAVDSGVWIGAFESGVNFYNYKTKSIRHCFRDNDSGIPMSNISPRTILADSKSNLWVGTLLGFLYKVHLPSGAITKISDKQFAAEYANITVYHLWEHSSGAIWIGTKNKGLVILHPDSNTIEPLDAGGLLYGKNVYGFIEDQNKQIWITTNTGLILYNPQVNSIRHFAYSDGIQGNIFTPQAVYKDHRDRLYFGGTNGFTRINPNHLKTNVKKPNTIISKVSTNNNKSIFPKYSKNFEIETVNLSPEETTFRINFWADNYLMPEKNKYKYRLINYYDDWIDIQNEGSVLFTNLRPGKYTFEVKASNNDGIWNDAPTRMHIEIMNYWYQTAIAYFIYSLVFAILFYFISRFFIERARLKKAVIREKYQRRNEEQIHEMKLKFFTNISHEFRTPLTLISWPLKKLIQAENITTEQREELEVVSRNSNRLLQLINQIIDLRKLEKGKSKLNVSQIDIITFIHELQAGFAFETKAKEIDFVLDSPFTSLPIEADLEKLDTILYNLLSNAYKFAPQKGTIRISVNQERNNPGKSYSSQLSFGQIDAEDFVEISIEDSGPGIDSEDLLTIFNRFEQGRVKGQKETEKIHGSGIGLSLCKEFTILHRGEITAQSNVGNGSRFTIVLPVKQKAHAILFESHQEYKNLKSAGEMPAKLGKELDPKKRANILVVEDNNDFRTFICKFLNQYYHIEYATNGKEALDLLRKRAIDLVVSDVMMPKMDGFEFCSIVKAQVETSHIPVILLTALSSSENLIVGLDRGADAYLSKPFDEEVLLKQIENILEQRRRIHKNFSKQFLTNKTVEVSGLDNFFLDRVRVVVEKNITNETFGMEILAKELMISRSQLHRKIKSLSGVTTSDFVNLVRIKKAVELIERENYRFNEVAFHVGFSSQSYFNKCFKKVYNATPKEYFEKHN
jgi:signal transduction histidine kinase/ligand-binding sensor domain-containing protein/DNA-binding response OmpR family regulator